jgi:hypothetical protein
MQHRQLRRGPGKLPAHACRSRHAVRRRHGVHGRRAVLAWGVLGSDLPGGNRLHARVPAGVRLRHRVQLGPWLPGDLRSGQHVHLRLHGRDELHADLREQCKLQRDVHWRRQLQQQLRRGKSLQHCVRLRRAVPGQLRRERDLRDRLPWGVRLQRDRLRQWSAMLVALRCERRGPWPRRQLRLRHLQQPHRLRRRSAGLRSQLSLTRPSPHARRRARAC